MTGMTTVHNYIKNIWCNSARRDGCPKILLSDRKALNNKKRRQGRKLKMKQREVLFAVWCTAQQQFIYKLTEIAMGCSVNVGCRQRHLLVLHSRSESLHQFMTVT